YTMTLLTMISLALLSISTAQAAPLSRLEKRIAQVIPEATAKWEQACLAAGGGQQCNPQSVAAFSTLLAAPGPCEQQDQADKMIDLAKQLNNNAEMISQSVLYCQSAPRNQELSGLFQCQFQGVNDNIFTGGVPAGSPGTIPFGRSSAPSPPGSCPANPGGKIPDGQQLNNIVNNPGSGNTGGNNNNNGNNGNNNNNGNNGNNGNGNNGNGQQAPAPTTTAAAPANTPPANNNNGNTGTTPSTGTGFQLSNAQAAQQLNVKFQSLAVGGACTVGEVACIGDAFAQCPFGTFITTPCAGGLKCRALPLVNSVGTSVTCTTDDDAARRFAAAGASGGFDGRQ
ncbi:14940_t:CDS:2, partial [Acaulospora colombiana]